MRNQDRGTDELPDSVEEKESQNLPGRLKIFLGAFPGAGKTYALLDAAQRRNHNGEQVVMGIVETHGRAETEALTRGLELLPRRQVVCSGVTLYEFDLNAALARRPLLVLIDDLAHTNAPGSRHVKRWQDVAELLAARINVYAAMNVQDLESLNDVVAQITGVQVRETIPDSILERADEIEFIDLSPDELLQRLNEGKVYQPEQSARTAPGFFRRGNLIALRELALRLTAARVDEQMRRYKRDHSIEQVWPANERILVCIGPRPSAARLVRSARQMAMSMHAEWEAVHVETPDHAHLPTVERERIGEALRLAEHLGGHSTVLHGRRVSEELLIHARERNVTRIIVGKTHYPHWHEWLPGSVVRDLMAHSGDIDVYAISGDTNPGHMERNRLDRPPLDWTGFLGAAVSVALCTALAALIALWFTLANLSIIMIYLLGVVIVAMRFGRIPSTLAVVASVLAFDYFFVPPIFSFVRPSSTNCSRRSCSTPG